MTYHIAIVVQMHTLSRLCVDEGRIENLRASELTILKLEAFSFVSFGSLSLSLNSQFETKRPHKFEIGGILI